MLERMQLRLALLRKEYEVGEVRLMELERQRSELTDTMLRISGAIQVLEELAAEAPEGSEYEDGNAVRPEPGDRLPSQA